MKIELVIETDDPAMIDETNSTGLSGPAYDELIDSLMEQGYSIADGPDRVR
jgi:hypothetical protein